MSPEQLHALCLGACLRGLRRLQDMGQVECAKLAGLSQPVLHRMEVGTRHPDVYRARKLAQALGTTLPELLKAAEECHAMALKAGHALVGSVAMPSMEYLRGRLGNEGLRALVEAACAMWLSSPEFHSGGEDKPAQPLRKSTVRRRKLGRPAQPARG